MCFVAANINLYHGLDLNVLADLSGHLDGHLFHNVEVKELVLALEVSASILCLCLPY